MASSSREAVLRPSVLDRLMLPKDHGRGGERMVIGVRELIQAVERDLSWLLNTKRSLQAEIENLEEVRTSPLSYGMPDLATLSWQSERDLTSLARVIEDQVRRFEPRLRAGSVKVTFVKPDEAAEARGESQKPRYRIDAVLQVDPVSEPVSFDTEIDASANQITVRSQA